MTMNFAGFFKKQKETDEIFDNLEDTLSEMMDLELLAPSVEMKETGGHEEDEVVAVDEDNEPVAAEAKDTKDAVETGDRHRLTFHTQSRLAALTAFDEVLRGADNDLQQLNDMLVRVNAAHHSTRDFLSTMHTSIYRANELELSNASLLAENRKLLLQVEQVTKLRSRHETLAEAFKRRESKLVNDIETLKAALEDARQEARDAMKAVSTIEAERATLLSELTVKSAGAERHSRENEVLREKQVGLSVEIKNAQRRYTDIERKFDELSAIHEAESAQIVELRSKVERAETESYQLQKQFDASQAKLAEMEDALAAAESTVEGDGKRHADEMQKLKARNDALTARLDAAEQMQAAATKELAETQQKLADAMSEKKAVEDRLAALTPDYAAESVAGANSAGQPDPDMPAVHAGETEELRREIASLKATIRKLNPSKRIEVPRSKVRRVNGSAKRTDAHKGTNGTTARSA